MHFHRIGVGWTEQAAQVIAHTKIITNLVNLESLENLEEDILALEQTDR